MSTSLEDGGAVEKDPDAKLVYVWDWDADLASGASIVTSTWIITGPDSALTYDNAAIVSGARQTSVRLLGGTAGRKYTVTNHYVSDTTPAEEDDRSITVRVKNL